MLSHDKLLLKLLLQVGSNCCVLITLINQLIATPNQLIATRCKTLAFLNQLVISDLETITLHTALLL